MENTKATRVFKVAAPADTSLPGTGNSVLSAVRQQVSREVQREENQTQTCQDTVNSHLILTPALWRMVASPHALYEATDVRGVKRLLISAVTSLYFCKNRQHLSSRKTQTALLICGFSPTPVSGFPVTAVSRTPRSQCSCYSGVPCRKILLGTVTWKEYEELKIWTHVHSLCLLNPQIELLCSSRSICLFSTIFPESPGINAYGYVSYSYTKTPKSNWLH